MCTSVRKYLDWQWNVNAWGKQDNPSTAVRIYLLYPEFTDNSSILDLAFNWLVYGQRQNEEALFLYRQCREFGEDHLFYTIMGASWERKVDLSDVKNHLEWQAHNNPFSLAEALKCWKSNSSSDLVNQHVVKAMYYLLSGQRHSPNTSQLYRACFAEQPYELFQMVDELTNRLFNNELIHPWLMGEKPSPQNISDIIPK